VGAAGYPVVGLWGADPKKSNIFELGAPGLLERVVVVVVVVVVIG
jgi:hypothetical protein